jgi:regulator of replication initiation timing
MIFYFLQLLSNWGFSLYLQLREYEERVMALSKDKDQLIKQRDSALQEAHLWRSELAKARERVVILEAAVVRGEEKVRVAEADAEARIKEAAQKESDAIKSKEELLAYVNMLQSQLQRFGINSPLSQYRGHSAFNTVVIVATLVLCQHTLGYKLPVIEEFIS